MEILDGQNLSTIKKYNIPSEDKKDISQYSFFIFGDIIYVSTSFNKIFRYDFNLQELNFIDSHFKDNTFIKIKIK